jgi:hypothetical protein
VKIGCIYRGGVACMVDEVDNELKLFFKLSSSVRYYAQKFGVLLHIVSRVSNQMFGQHPMI